MAPTPMHIAHVIAGVAEGGLRRHVIDLTLAQAETGHRVSVIAQADLLAALDERVARRKARLHLGRRNPLALLALSRMLRELSPDVIHAHASKAARMVRSVRLLPSLSRVPSVATAHGLKADPKPYRGHNALIAVSSAAAARLARADAHVIPNGIAPPNLPPDVGPALTRRACGFDDELPIAIAAGRLAPVKGYDVLVRAWKGLDANLAIAGDGPEMDSLRALVDRLDLADRVRLLGWRDDVPALVAGANMMVFSSHREGFPYAMVEALHAGTPIISTRVGALAELLPPQCVCDPGDAQALHTALARGLREPRTLRDLFAPIVDSARTELTLEHMAQRTNEVYAATIRRKKT